MSKKPRICITLPENTYKGLLECCKVGKMTKSKYIELALNSTINFELIKKEAKIWNEKLQN